MQKDVLGQDIFLIGPPGPKKRSIALQYLELTNREYEYVALSRDTTESDLKQRKEIVQGTAEYYDQVGIFMLHLYFISYWRKSDTDIFRTFVIKRKLLVVSKIFAR